MVVDLPLHALTDLVGAGNVASRYVSGAGMEAEALGAEEAELLTAH